MPEGCNSGMEEQPGVFTWKVENQILDLGYLSVGLYTEFGNRYSSGHFQLGSAWKF
jgi:hypothetical protein